MTDNMNIQWYPGHMTKTRRQIEADLKLVDAVCEIVDALLLFSRVVYVTFFISNYFHYTIVSNLFQ